MAKVLKTKDPIEIEKWAEKRQGNPVIIKGTKDLVRIRFDPLNDEEFEEITWIRFAEIFKEKNLFFIYSKDENSRFYKFIKGPSKMKYKDIDKEKLKKNEFWKDKLSPEKFAILREGETEQPGSGRLLGNKKKGTYACAACGTELFNSDEKYKSGSGWPSFYDAITDNIELEQDHSHGMNRIEVKCKTCGSHLGHLFPDGPEPTGQRYCINSISLDFEPEKGNN